MDDALPRLDSLDQLEALIAEGRGLHLRYSKGPEHDRGEASVDGESGLRLPGLSVNPLDPQAWWTRPLRDWLARQVCQYRHLSDGDPDRIAWVLRGREVGRGPDSEPLLADVQPLAVLSDALLDEADRIYHERFDAGNTPG